MIFIRQIRNMFRNTLLSTKMLPCRRKYCGIFVHEYHDPINNQSGLVQVIACHRRAKSIYYLNGDQSLWRHMASHATYSCWNILATFDTMPKNVVSCKIYKTLRSCVKPSLLDVIFFILVNSFRIWYQNVQSTQQPCQHPSLCFNYADWKAAFRRFAPITGFAFSI